DAHYGPIFDEAVGYPRTTLFFLTHLDRMWDSIQRAAEQTGTVRPHDFGNFERSSGMPPGTRSSQFAHWSTMRGTLPASIWFLLGCVVICLLAIADMARN